ncbi:MULTISPECIES: universal stress protein [Streptomyces]|uniref:Universal stress protein n=4 Tax=Streptomyces TaxID=1883 RepID=A0ABU4KF79_9ACTN|nr:universal stress protein [Streptomyces roseolus]MDX2296453.1 universal stress protein [Streptomyces roseolus]
MTHGIVFGLDGTDQANAAARWAAEEAVLRGTRVHLVHVKETPPDVPLPFAPREPDEAWAEDLLARTAAGLRERHPDLAVTTRLLPSEPVVSLVAAAEQSELLVLGSRALGGTTGYLIGSVGMSVAGLVSRPVVLVRALDMSPPRGPVVVGVDLRHPVDTALGFAFEAAARRLAHVQVVYAQQLPAYATLGPAMVPDIRLAVAPEIQRSLDDLLEPWQAKFPDVAASGRVTIGSAGQELVHTAAAAALVVIGRRTRGSALGSHIGSVAHAVLHHSRSPVALVPHG